MLLTLTTTMAPATDLGFLLHKNPSRAQAFPLSAGVAHVFWSEATAEIATCALFVAIDPVALSRSKAPHDARPLEPYVNDRPYVGSSLLSVAIAEVFATALGGRCAHRPDLVDQPIPLVIQIPAVRSHGGERLLRVLFEPLGYEVKVGTQLLDATYPAWGVSNVVSVELATTKRLCDVLRHLYVLIPVLDDDKHYWVGDAEVAKLVRHARDWMGDHPERDLIAARYLKHQGRLARAALMRIADGDEAREPAPELELARDPAPAVALAAGSGLAPEPAKRLNDVRLDAVCEAIAASGATSVLDLGCGEGKLVSRLARDGGYNAIVGVDVATGALAVAEARLERLSERQRAPVKLLHGSLVYRDRRLRGFDVAACVEVVEHLDPSRLAAFAGALFGDAKPRRVILTTPNREYNVKYENVDEHRHEDHRFEWTRAEFEAWARSVAQRYAYDVRFEPIGDDDPDVGPPTQMGVFTSCR